MHSEENRFTAFDHEIFADLNKLDLGSKQFVFKRKFFNKLSMNFEQKTRKTIRKVKQIKENKEKEVVQALTILMDFFEPESLENTEQEIFEFNPDEIAKHDKLTIPVTKIIENGFCRQSIPSTLKIFSIQLPNETSESLIQTV